MKTDSLPSEETQTGYDWNRLFGYLLTAAGVACYATVEVTVRDANIRLEEPVPPMMLTALRFLISGMLFTSFTLVLPAGKRRFPEKGDMLRILLLGIVGAPAAIGLFQFALTFRAMKASTCAVIFSINPIFVAVLAPFLLRERIRAKEWTGLIMGFGGALIMSCSFSGLEAEKKELFAAGGIMLLSAFLFALYIVMSKPFVKKYGAFMYTGWAFLFGGSAAGVISLCIEKVPDLSLLHMSRGTLDIVWIIFGGTAMGYYCYLAGLSKVNVARGSYLFFMKPFLALVFSLVYLNEGMFESNEWAGFGLIAAGLALVLFIPDRFFNRLGMFTHSGNGTAE